MASELGLPPPAPTTITDIGDDLLREIFLLLPSLPSFVRAALACRTFLHAVRSSPVFRRRFQANHPPQILGFFSEPCRPSIPLFSPIRISSDPDLAAASRGADFLLTRLPEDSADSHSGWEMESCYAGYVVLVNETADQIAAYNPLTQVLDIFPSPPGETILSRSLEFHIVVSEEDLGLGVFHMLCVKHSSTSENLPACIAVFSSATREWKVSPWVETSTQPQPEDDGNAMIMYYNSGTQLNHGLVYWGKPIQGYITIINIATLQLHRVDFPSFLGEIDYTSFCLGHTEDGKLFMVAADYSDPKMGMLDVLFWKADDDGVEKWMLEHAYQLNTFVDATKSSTEHDATLEVGGFIDGFVYLSYWYDEHTQSLLSLCLDTGKLNKLFDDTYATPAYPYIMAWPPSLVYNKAGPCLKIPEDSQTKVVGDNVSAVGPVGTKETSSVLVSEFAITQNLINHDGAKFTQEGPLLCWG